MTRALLAAWIIGYPIAWVWLARAAIRRRVSEAGHYYARPLAEPDWLLAAAATVTLVAAAWPLVLVAGLVLRAGIATIRTLTKGHP